MQDTRLPIAELSRQMMRGYDWGLAARNLGAPMRHPDEISRLPSVLPDEVKAAVVGLFAGETAGLELLEKADTLVDKWPELEDLREYLCDLCVLRIIVEGEDDGEEDFMESPEWEAVMEQTGERGTELLNLLVYLRDCLVNKVEPGLDDFLNEFLMVDEEDFQDEMMIYEDFIRHQELVEGSLKQLIQTGNSVRSVEMQEIFTPVMLFFKDRELTPGKVMLHLLNESRAPELHAALYLLLSGFYMADSGGGQPLSN